MPEFPLVLNKKKKKNLHLLRNEVSHTYLCSKRFKTFYAKMFIFCLKKMHLFKEYFPGFKHLFYVHIYL